MFTMFMDRDGKYKHAALSESGIDPMARSCKFILTEQAQHLIVGESGVEGTDQRSCELMKQTANDDARAEGGIDLPSFQMYINLWCSIYLDLLGGVVSSNGADAFAECLKGRYKEATRFEDHACLDSSFEVDMIMDGKIDQKAVPMRTAMNEVLRDDYYADCNRAVGRWNKIISKTGVNFELKLPSKRFNRQIGTFAEYYADPDGNLVSEVEWEARKGEWLPNQEDEIFVQSLMKPVTEPGKIANWIAPPRRGINGQPFEFEYVRHDQ